MLTRRKLLKLGLITASQATLLRTSPLALSQTNTAKKITPAGEFPSKRPVEGKRNFRSTALEMQIREVGKRIADPELRWLFENCYPNALDTTVHPGTIDGKPDTFVVTGDIDAMWLRDSAAQVSPYLPLAGQDRELRNMLEGVIRRQTRCLLIDPYANAFQKETKDAPLEWSLHDDTEMRPGVGERKWEIDSVCYPIRLASGYWRVTQDKSPFDESWRAAMHLVVATLTAQQRKHGPGPYRFQRPSKVPSDTLSESGYGPPGRPVGLIHSGFRPSDDACTFPFLIPSNLFAVVVLRDLAKMAEELLGDAELATNSRSLAAEVAHALDLHGKARHSRHGEIWAYEVDGFGNALFADDANVPSLLALPYLGSTAQSDVSYQKTRAFVLSEDNPYFFKGKAAEGIGGPHVGANQVWPMSIILRALTSNSQAEIRACLHWLKTTHGDTGFMHESFDKDDPAKFTRPWFAWANSLFGELVVKVSREHPNLLA